MDNSGIFFSENYNFCYIHKIKKKKTNELKNSSYIIEV